MICYVVTETRARYDEMDCHAIKHDLEKLSGDLCLVMHFSQVTRERIEDVVLNRRDDAAERLLEIAERRGDEGLVLAAAYILERTSAEPARYRAIYDRVARWSFNSSGLKTRAVPTAT